MNSKRRGLPRTVKVLAMTYKGMFSYPTKNREEEKTAPDPEANADGSGADRICAAGQAYAFFLFLRRPVLMASATILNPDCTFSTASSTVPGIPALAHSMKAL